MNTPITGKHRHFTDLPIRCCLMSSALTRMQAFSIFKSENLCCVSTRISPWSGFTAAEAAAVSGTSTRIRIQIIHESNGRFFFFFVNYAIHHSLPVLCLCPPAHVHFLFESSLFSVLIYRFAHQKLCLSCQLISLFFVCFLMADSYSLCCPQVIHPSVYL